MMRLAGTEEDSTEFPEHCCQNCGFDLSGWRGEGVHQWRSGPRQCDECPRCGERPYWISGGIRTETRKELLHCKGCEELFVRRASVTIDSQHCGNRDREVVRRHVGEARCDACGLEAKARHYERLAVSTREKSKGRRAQQRRGVEVNMRLAQKQKAIAKKERSA